MSSLSNILSFIQLKGISTAEFERECGLPNATLSNYQSRDGDITSKNIEKISKRYGKELLNAGYSVIDLAVFGGKGYIIVADKAKKEDEQAAALPAQQDPTPMQILSVLAGAFKDQAETLRIQVGILGTINKEMARQDSQARLEANLNETLAGVEFVSKIRIQQVLDQLQELKAQRKVPVAGERKRPGEGPEDGHKPGIRPL